MGSRKRWISKNMELPVEKHLLLPKENRYHTNVFSYLTGRGIDNDIVRFCIETGRIYESTYHHNAVFVGMDQQGKPQYVALRGINTDFIGEANGLIVITPDFDDFTAKFIATDKYSKYITEISILEGVTNREYYGRSATTIENKCKIEYGTEQGLAALIYGEKGLSSLPIQDVT